MKKMCFLWLFMGFVMMASAQDIAPGQQAQGYLNDKNATVDYATGIFHYKVPLYTLGNGGFSLPVSLDYTAKGVKTADSPGLVGYNWTLNTGGVVTRTIRGGIADEIDYNGYLYCNLWREDTVPLAEDVKRVNRHQRDGESDIFTAVFNGQSIHFILGLDADERICALPLERTNVRIECEQSGFLSIDGWTITDEEGNRYIYRQKEWSSDIVKEDAVSFNGLRGENYVSSWYLSRIEPVNGSPLVYHYLADVKYNGEQDNIQLSRFCSGYTTHYSYGRKLQEHTFDFEPFRDDFNTAISEARFYLNSFSFEMQLNNSLYELTAAGQWVRNPNFEQGVQAINNNFRVMGQLADFRNISSASNELIDLLNQLDETYSAQSSHNAQMAAMYFRMAKGYVIESLEQVEEVSEREVANGTSLTVRSPLLTQIVCGNHVLRFAYRYSGYNTRLMSLQSGSVSGVRFSGVELENNTHLNRLSFTGNDSTSVRTLNFEYYGIPSDVSCGTDMWGYYRDSDEERPFWVFGDAECTRISSLKSIALSDGGRIQIDYEPNASIPYPYQGSGFLTDSMPYGGLRLKSLIYHDGISVSGDTVLYRYPLPGIPMYSEITNVEVLSYSGFSDCLTHSQMKFKGLAFLKTGNNGLYYRQVEEIRPGQGKKSYTFHVPFCFLLPNYTQYYPFWLVGLPLSVSEYDEDGHLLRSVHNHYETDLSKSVPGLDLDLNEDYFSACSSDFCYVGEFPQLKADENYMDAEYLENYYRNQATVLIYRDGLSSYSLSPYYNVYLPNIQPRTTRQPSNVAYTLFYGGKTLLTSQKEYRYASPEGDGELFCSTEYFYDNPEGSVHPTRIVRTDACGDRYTEATMRVTEMNVTADTSLSRMVAANMLSLPVKQAYLKNDSLLTETVNVYTAVANGTRHGMGIEARYTYTPQQPSAYQMDVPASSLFTYGQSNYTLEEENDYCWNRDLFLPSDCCDRMSETAFSHDRHTGATLLEMASTGSAEMAAMDLHAYLEHFSGEEYPFSELLYSHVYYKRFYEALLVVQEMDTLLSQYFTSSPRNLFVRLIEIVGCSRTDAYGELPSLCDSVNVHIDDFHQFLSIGMTVFEQQFPENESDFLRMAADNITYTVYIGLLSDPFFLALGDVVLDYENSDSVLAVCPAAGTDRLCLYVVCQSENADLSWNVYHSGGMTVGSGQTVSTSAYSLQKFDIDLSSFEEVSRVRISLPFLDSGVHYMALVPDGMPFCATSYNADGTVFCTFDQSGRLEVNEYDAAGRLLRVRDQHGQLLESYEHHVVNP